jgi:hypothetical protein
MFPFLLDVFKCETWHFNWPHLQEGQLFAVTDGRTIITSTTQRSPYSDSALSALLTGTATATSFSALAENLEVTWCKKKGVVLAGGVQAVAFLRPFKHLRRLADGSIRKVFAADECVPCPVQLLITNLPNLDDRLIERESLSVADFCVMPDKIVMFVGSKAQFFGRVGQVERAVDDGRALRIALAAMPDASRLEKCKNDLLQAVEEGNRLFLDAKEAAGAAGIPPWLLSKLTSTMQVLPTSNTNQPMNLGFSVKFEGKSLAAPGLARRLSPGQWQYSRELIALLHKYRAACPKVFAALLKAGPGADRPTASQLQLTPAEINDARNWLKENVKVPTLRPCQGVSFVTNATCLASTAKTLEGLQISALLKKEQSESVIVTPADLITRADCAAFLNGSPAHSSAAMKIGDLVVWCGDGADGLPFGELGLVVGVFGVEEVWILLAEERKGVAERFFPGPLMIGSWRAWAGASTKWMKVRMTGDLTRAKKPITTKKGLSFSTAAAATTLEKERSVPLPVQEKSVDLLTKIFAAAHLNGASSSVNSATPANSTSNATSNAQVKSFTTRASSASTSNAPPIKKFTIKKRTE